MQTDKTRSRSLSTSQVLAMTYTGLLGTHMVQRVSEDKEWLWWAWAVALTVQMLWAVVMSFRHHAR